MIFRDLLDLKLYVDSLIYNGLGHCQPMLDRRGCDCAVTTLRLNRLQAEIEAQPSYRSRHSK